MLGIPWVHQEDRLIDVEAVGDAANPNESREIQALVDEATAVQPCCARK
jgi:hypothetical protein